SQTKGSSQLRRAKSLGTCPTQPLHSSQHPPSLSSPQEPTLWDDSPVYLASSPSSASPTSFPPIAAPSAGAPSLGASACRSSSPSSSSSGASVSASSAASPP